MKLSIELFGEGTFNVSSINKLVIALLALINANMMFAQSLYINEIQVANIDQFIDPSFNYGAWIELYNPGTDDINLAGHAIRHTTNEGTIKEYSLKFSQGKVPAHGFVVLWFDHNSNDGYYGPNAGNQIPFKLDADGGLIELLDVNLSVVDAVEFPQSVARCSWARISDGASEFGWTTQATPKASNNNSIFAEERLNAPVVSSTGGVFDGSYDFTVKIPVNTTLYYTTDGTTPNPDVASISTDGHFIGNENIIYRFMLAKEGFLNSPVVTRSFFKQEGKFSLPILSVTTTPANFFDNTIGLYVIGTNGRSANNSPGKANQNMDWERPVNVEYFVPDESMHYKGVINKEANFSIFGGWTRFNNGYGIFPYRTSFKLKSDKVYEGSNSFDYPIFDSKPFIKLRNILVRNGGQDQYARIWDGAIQELIRTSGVYLDCQAWQPAQVYLDGNYLGVLNLREESNKWFAYSNYGIKKGDVDQYTVNSDMEGDEIGDAEGINAWENDIVIKEGDREKLDEWLNLSKDLAKSPSDSTIWNKICEIVDIDEYCNYMAAETYMGNLDWLRGGLKNVKGFRAREDGGKFHIVLHDVDGGFGYTDMIVQLYNKGTGSLPTRFKNMLKYEPFKKQFIDAYCIMDGSVFEPERCEPIITEMKNTLNSALVIEGQSADEKAEQLISRLSDNVERKPALKQSLKKVFNLKDEYSVKIKSNISQARMILNGQEIPTGKFNGYLFSPIVLTSSAPEGYVFKGWNINGQSIPLDSVMDFSREYSPDTYNIEAVYQYVGTSLPPVRINEISSGNDIFISEYGKKSDWVELYNTTDKEFDLVGTYLSDNPQNIHKYQIPTIDSISTIIPPYGYKIIWCDDRESKTQLHVPFKLKNDDDSFVSITDENDKWTDALYYKSQPRWTTYSRFPDGGMNVALTERPTIGTANHICTNTTLNQADGTTDAIKNPIEEFADHQIKSIKYYNLRGQQISNIEREQIVIQRITYTNGTQLTRKISVK